MKTYKSNISEFGLRLTPTDIKKVKIQCSSDAADYIRQFYGDDIAIYESFFLLLLNRANNTTGFVKISQGGTVGTVIDIKIIAKYAIDSLSSSVILAHNHPSGTMVPSGADSSITRKIKDALALFDVQVLDHLILGTENKYYSFADEGML